MVKWFVQSMYYNTSVVAAFTTALERTVEYGFTALWDTAYDLICL